MSTATVTPPRFPAHVAARIAATYVRPSANWGTCPECNGNAGPNHQCPQKPRSLAADVRREIAGAAA